MDPRYFLELAEKILEGYEASFQELLGVARAGEAELPFVMAGAHLIRQGIFGAGIHVCSIQNAKSGRCPEDCAFCAQSVHASTDAPVYGFVGREEIIRHIKAIPSLVHRFSVVTSGRRLEKKYVEEIALAYQGAKDANLRLCASLGSIGREELEILKEAGLTRYHHNLETAPSYFPKICTTHTFEERVNTIKQAKELGLEVCSGGIFGLGESDEQVVELAQILRQLDVDSVAVNFLTPIKGTRLGDMKGPPALRCLKIISIFRFCLPRKEVIICGGREQNLKELHPLVFYAGASGIMTGNYLTTQGRTFDNDMEMLENLGLYPRPL
jgi:biotin synthase